MEEIIKRKVGRPKGTTGIPRYSNTATKAKIQARKELADKERDIKKLERKLTKKRSNFKDKKSVLEKVELAIDPKNKEQTIKNTVMTNGDFEKAPKKVRDFIKENKESIVFKPNDGPQTDFLAANEQDVLYGGAAGGGKSYAMLVDPLRFMHKSAHRALLLRRSMPELRELIDKSRELYTKAFPGAKFREVEKLWKFPSGATLEFGYLDRDADVYRYQGQSYSWIGIDELTQYPTEFPLQYLQSRLRTTDSEIKTYIRCTANPGGVGGHWVKKRYLDLAPPNESFQGKDGLTRKFIPARLSDNPYLSEDGRYEKMLESLPPTQRKQLLDGNWNVSEGAAFTEFDSEIHVIPPFKIPFHWMRVKGVDYGYASESACIWATIDPDDDTLIVYKELYRKGLTGEDLSNMMIEFEREEKRSIQGVLDYAAWNRTGVGGPTVGETLVRAGHKLRPADKNRIQGKIQVHERLKQSKDTGRPRLQIFNTCVNLIRELQSIPIDMSKPEDVDTKASDHAYDALRYLIMSRPQKPSSYQEMSKIKRFAPSDPTFGY